MESKQRQKEDLPLPTSLGLGSTPKARTISRRLVANGLHSCRPLRRLPLTPPNRRQRLEWCRARSTWMTEWHRVVFSDESRFCLSSDSRRVRVWRRRGERSNPAAIVERPTVRQRGIMVWGAIAYDSRSPLLRIQGTMTAQRYVDDVLRPVTLPYLQGVPNALYQQDNARPHTARISQQALQDVQMLPWPPYSPDLSPIEHVWDIIGRRLPALPQPRSEDELWQMNMPPRRRPLIGRNTAASRRYRNARALETPLQRETRRELRRLRSSEARVAATQTMQVPVQRIQLWTHKPFSEPDSEHKFLQIYFIDNYESQVTARCNITANLNRDLVRSLQDLLHAHNHYIQSFKAALETLPQNHADYRVIIHSDKLPPEEHERRYNAPMTNEVALLMMIYARHMCLHVEDIANRNFEYPMSILRCLGSTPKARQIQWKIRLNGCPTPPGVYQNFNLEMGFEDCPLGDVIGPGFTQQVTGLSSEKGRFRIEIGEVLVSQAMLYSSEEMINGKRNVWAIRIHVVEAMIIMKQFDEADSNKEGIATRKKHSRRSDRVRGEEFVKNVKEKIDGNPGKSMRARAKEMDVGSMTIVRTIHEDLGLKSYALRKGQLLTENMKNNRKRKVAALLNNLKHDSFGMLRFFSDEKNFDVDQKVNPRNDRWICKDPSEIPVVMHTKFPASVMVLGVISSEGDVMPPHFFEKGLRMNADTYINVLETVVKPWMDMVAAGRKYVFQQDSAPAHKAKKTQSWLTLNVPSHWGPDIWPLILQIAIPSTTMYGALLREMSTKLLIPPSSLSRKQFTR
ncbi:hypothetical protein LAZ67_9001141 [Cordylochernes scorpioides]|uniref:Transposase n=1 Tax=Cordylochernes scorpioides TaxID=51811 RepID=A0ABY6KUG6_9ARAC|nr:hypothetical protein LAZ67_9001141 [Cordylochernes scorpioides]